MFRIRPLLCVALLALNATAATKALRFGKLWDGHRIIPNAVVIVEDQKVQSVMSRGRMPARAEVVDLTPYTAIPGMIDAHTHMTYYWDGRLEQHRCANQPGM